MSLGFNKAILIGNLGKDPEVMEFDNGVKKVLFPLATTEIIKNRSTGEQRTETEWHNVVMWRSVAEIAEKFLKKGDRVHIEGKVKSRTYVKDEYEHFVTEIIADNFIKL